MNQVGVLDEKGRMMYAYVDDNNQSAEMKIAIDGGKVKHLQQSDLVFNASGDVIGTKDN
jgi:hypothetical protein